jgi:hypothetical protein
MRDIEAIRALCISCVPVGSRVTCNPAPVDTDEDYLALVAETMWPALTVTLSNGWEIAGSRPADQCNINGDTSFVSFTSGHLNLIVTASPVFHQRFMAATSVAKRLNLLSKDDRIALFQAVLYANASPSESTLVDETDDLEKAA